MDKCDIFPLISEADSREIVLAATALIQRGPSFCGEIRTGTKEYKWLEYAVQSAIRSNGLNEDDLMNRTQEKLK